MKEYDEFRFNRLQERAWESEKKLEESELEEKNGEQEETDADESDEWDNELCRACRSGESLVNCEVCRLL
jgi:hypothetical protein